MSYYLKKEFIKISKVKNVNFETRCNKKTTTANHAAAIYHKQ